MKNKGLEILVESIQPNLGYVSTHVIYQVIERLKKEIARLELEVENKTNSGE
jgi:uncharacterized small protein (DUF1192 family)